MKTLVTLPPVVVRLQTLSNTTVLIRTSNHESWYVFPEDVAVLLKRLRES